MPVVDRQCNRDASPGLARSSLLSDPLACDLLPSRLRALRSLADGSKLRCPHCPTQASTRCTDSWHNDVTDFIAIGVDLRYRNREPILEEDGSGDFAHIVLEGLVRLHRSLADGRRLVQGFALPGDFLGFSMDKRHTYAATALGPVSTCKISRKAYFKFLEVKPHLMRRLLAEITSELTLANDHMMLLGRFTVRERTAAFLLNMRDRWQRVSGHSTYIALPMTRQDIADFLGVTIETVCRMISTFAREKLILVVPDGVRVLDVTRLETIANRFGPSRGKNSLQRAEV
jgi:CRP/FNR family transcriptional regulator